MKDPTTRMEAFNERYRKVVDAHPHQVLRMIDDPGWIDDTFWVVTRVTVQRGPRRGSLLATTFEALFTGPKSPSASGRYECMLTTIIERWEGQGDPPIVQPGRPRPPDW